MSLVQGDYGTMIHGVSQQPDERKAKGQVREQINCRSNVTKGLSSRAAFELVGKLTPDTAEGGLLTNAKWKVQQRGDGKDFIIAYDVTRPCIFDLNADRKPFTFDADTEAYYKASLTNPQQQLSIDSVLDTTFISNRNVIPLGDNANDDISTPDRVTWIEFKTMSAGAEIEISINISGAITVYKTQVFEGFVTIDPATGKPDDIDAKRTREFDGSYHAAAFVTEVASTDVTSYNNWVRIGVLSSTTIKLGGESITLHENRSIKSVEVLPPFAITGDVCVVEKAKEKAQALGYFIANAIDFGLFLTEVRWTETVAPNSSGEVDPTTMPHRLVRDTSDNFSLKPIDWRLREVGDKKSNPYPSFITAGTAISSVGIFQNRLYLASNETVFLSAVDAFYDLWRESSFYNTDADPFEVFADTNELNIIKYAEDFDGDLIFFSDNGQFAMRGDTVHTYNTASISAVSQYKTDFSADPVLSGDNIFFGINYGSFAGVRELYTDGSDRTKRALPVTTHVDEYIVGSITHMATSTNLDALCCLNDANPNEVYIYEWKRDVQGSLKQQAWHKWKLQEDVTAVWVGFVESSLYAVVSILEIESTEPTFYLWELKWDDPDTTHGVNFAIALDGRFVIDAVTYNQATNISIFTVPYDREDLTFVEGVGSLDVGFEVGANRLSSYTWQALGDYTNIQLIGGMKYQRLIELPNPQMKDRDGISKGIDRLHLSKMFMHFSKVGQMEVKIEDTHGRERILTYNNRRIGLANNQPSSINTDADTWDFGIRKKAEGLTMTLTSDDVTPFELRAIEWRGNFKQKGRR